MPLNDSITIIISTRNRRDDLSVTLNRLIELDLALLPLMIVDDASDLPILADDLMQKFPRLRFIRNDVQRGLIVNRNEMARLATTPYVLSLDDDSCFRDKPDLTGAIDYLSQKPDLVGLQFNNVDVNFGEKPVDKTIPYRVQTYTGCGHLLKRELFLRLGGYRPDFVHMTEEVEFCRKAWKVGLGIHMFPTIVVDHRRTPVARFPKKNIYYLTRNNIIHSYLHLPLFAMLPKLLSNAILSWARSGSKMYLWPGIFSGWFDGLKYCYLHAPERVPMRPSQYKKFREAPVNR